MGIRFIERSKFQDEICNDKVRFLLRLKNSTVTSQKILVRGEDISNGETARILTVQGGFHPQIFYFAYLICTSSLIG
jgi:hypothetical protein